MINVLQDCTVRSDCTNKTSLLCLFHSLVALVTWLPVALSPLWESTQHKEDKEFLVSFMESLWGFFFLSSLFFQLWRQPARRTSAPSPGSERRRTTPCPRALSVCRNKRRDFTHATETEARGKQKWRRFWAKCWGTTSQTFQSRARTSWSELTKENRRRREIFHCVINCMNKTKTKNGRTPGWSKKERMLFESKVNRPQISLLSRPRATQFNTNRSLRIIHSQGGKC